MTLSVDLGMVRRYRDELRQILPDLRQDRASNETISACLSLLSEASLLRLVVEIQKLRGTQVQVAEAQTLMEELTGAFSESLSKIILRHVPDATFVKVFREPEPT